MKKIKFESKEIKKQRSSGITLIALVITIIVLLILAGISISMLSGDNSILRRAGEAKEKTEISSAKEQIQLQILGSYNNSATLDEDKLKTNLEKIGANVIEDGFPMLVSLNEYTFEIDEDENVTYIEGFDKYAPIPQDAVAKMNYKYYTTLQGAIDKVGTNNKKTTILLLKDVKENVTIEENKNIILNLDNHKLTNANDTAIITLSGTLKIENGTVLGTYTSKVATIYVNANSELNISNATIDRSGENIWETIQLYGNLNIDSGKINSPNSNAICTYANYDTNINISGTAEIVSSKIAISTKGRLVITGGTITSTSSHAIKNKGNLEISGTAEIRSSSNYNYATIYSYENTTTKITGGTITSTSHIAIYNKGKLEISGTAEISSLKYYAIQSESNSETKISGGNITSKGNITISNSGNLEVNGTAVISRTAVNPTYSERQCGYKWNYCKL